MADCECLPRCPFFHDQMESMPAMADMVKSQYCSGERADNTKCARHMVFLAFGSSKVPSDLYPSEMERARGLIGGR